jgi:LuxR family maltose regulon positive regulatory protein
MGGPEETVAARAAGVVARRALYARLSAGVSEGVTLVAAPAGSGKTVLLRSWIDEAGLRARTAWVLVERHERDAQRFWLSVVERLRSAVGGDGLVQEFAPAPEFDGEAAVRRLISELEALDEPVVLVIDDLHELVSPDAQAQLELLLARRPRLLYVVLATRHDPSLGLHRLRLAGELTELRAVDLRMSAEEARQLLEASGIVLSAKAAAMLVARTEGWAAGLRLATMSLAGHPDPERFVAAFAGSERTVADYLLAEVLERQREGVKQLLLRTSILERVCGPLADRLTGTSGSERTLLELEDANAFVVSVDPERSWFRYHPLFADLLLLELRRSEPDSVPKLHRAAAEWYAEHGKVIDAIKHAQAATDWRFAGDLVGQYGFSITLDGSFATMTALLEPFPAGALANPELAAFLAYGEVIRPSLDTAAAYIAVAERHASEVPEVRRRSFDAMLATARLTLARWRSDYGTALSEVRPMLEPVEAETVPEVAAGNDVRAVALMNLGIVRRRRRCRTTPRRGPGACPPERAALRGDGLPRASRRGGRTAFPDSPAGARRADARDHGEVRVDVRADRPHGAGNDGRDRCLAGPVRRRGAVAGSRRAGAPAERRARQGADRTIRARDPASRTGTPREGRRRFRRSATAPIRDGDTRSTGEPGVWAPGADAGTHG